MQRVPGVATTDVQGNGFMQDFRYRGFAASPLQGTPQGIAVYMNGIRVNEAFGDTVNWDLIPTNAISRADILTNNPIFGLNALGGAVNIQMKNGFTYHGLEAEVQGGSFGRRQRRRAIRRAAGQCRRSMSRRRASTTTAGATNRRRRSARFYTDLGWRGDGSEIHLIASGASNFFGVVGPTPIQLIDQDYRSIYTWPQTTRNDMGLLALNGNFDVATELVGAEQHLRPQVPAGACRRQRRRCRSAAAASSSFAGSLCLEDDGFPVPSGGKTTAFRDQFAILDANGNPIQFVSSTTPYGTIDRTWTDTLTIGGSLQATSDAKVFDHDNYFVVGGSIDHSQINFSADSDAGIYLSRSVGGGQRLRRRHRRRSSIRSAISATGRSASTRRTPITASTPSTPSTSPRDCRRRSARGSTSPRSAWRTSSAPAPSSTATTPSSASIR